MGNADQVDQLKTVSPQNEDVNSLFRNGVTDFTLQRDGNTLTFINAKNQALYLVVAKRAIPKEGDTRVDHIEENEFVFEFVGDSQNVEIFRLTAREQQKILKEAVKPFQINNPETVWQLGKYKLERRNTNGTYEDVSSHVVPAYKVTESEKTALLRTNVLSRATARLAPIQASLNFSKDMNPKICTTT